MIVMCMGMDIFMDVDVGVMDDRGLLAGWKHGICMP